MRIAIIIPTSQRYEMLCNCLGSVVSAAEQVSSKLGLTVYVGFNGDEEGFNQFDPSNFPSLHIKKTLFKEAQYPSVVRNKLVRDVEAEYFLFLDDDIELDANYLRLSMDCLQSNRIDILGGHDTGFLDVKYIEKLVSLSLCSPFVTSVTRSRHTKSGNGLTASTEEELTLSNLWVSKEVFNKSIFFNEKFKRNEENILVSAASDAGFVIKRFDRLFVYHHRRHNFDNFFIPSFYSGYYRILSMWHISRVFNVLYLVPLFTLLFTFYTLLNLTLNLWIFHILYLLCLFTFALLQVGKIRLIDILPLVFVQLALIVSYSFGQLYAIISFKFLRMRDAYPV